MDLQVFGDDFVLHHSRIHNLVNGSMCVQYRGFTIVEILISLKVYKNQMSYFLTLYMIAARIFKNLKVSRHDLIMLV